MAAPDGPCARGRRRRAGRLLAWTPAGSGESDAAGNDTSVDPPLRPPSAAATRGHLHRRRPSGEQLHALLGVVAQPEGHGGEAGAGTGVQVGDDLADLVTHDVHRQDEIEATGGQVLGYPGAESVLVPPEATGPGDRGGLVEDGTPARTAKARSNSS